MKPVFSIIIPVYNRPEELDELLASILAQEYNEAFDVCIIEDGSSVKSDLIVEKYKSELSIHYFEKENTGPGPSRNFGMQKATGNYFIILDSDVILPKHYLATVAKQLEHNIQMLLVAQMQRILIFLCYKKPSIILLLLF